METPLSGQPLIAANALCMQLRQLQTLRRELVEQGQLYSDEYM